MTGYGKAEAVLETGKMCVEIRTLNSKNADVNIKTQLLPKDKEMSDAYWELWNPEVQAKIDRDIEANRKADASLKLDGAAKGTKVSVEQISHDFIFGAHIFNFNQLGDKSINAKYRSLFGSLFNSATIPFYWDKFELEPGRPRFCSEYGLQSLPHKFYPCSL